MAAPKVMLVVAGLAVVPLLGLVLLGRKAPPPPRKEEGATVAAGPTAAREPPGPAARRAFPADSGVASRAVAARERVEEASAVAHENPARSRALLREALAKDPDYVPALTALSLKLLHDEHHQEARALAARCLSIAPDEETCTLVQSYALVGGAEADALAERTRGCLADDPRDAKCLAVMVGYDVLQGRMEEARAFEQRLAEVDPNGKSALLAHARLAGAEGRYEEARGALDDACRLGHEQACFRARSLSAEGW